MVVMGRVRAPHGLKGWIKVQPFTQETGGLLSYPDWWLGGEGRWQQHRVIESVVHGSMVVARLEGFVDREVALELRGKDVAVPRAALPDSGNGEFYWSDLLGMEVRERDETRLGIVARILETGANSVLVVQGEKEYLIPFIQNVVVNVDLKSKQVIVDWEEPV